MIHLCLKLCNTFSFHEEKTKNWHKMLHSHLFKVFEALYLSEHTKLTGNNLPMVYSVYYSSIVKHLRSHCLYSWKASVGLTACSPTLPPSSSTHCSKACSDNMKREKLHDNHEEPHSQHSIHFYVFLDIPEQEV